MDKFIIDGGEKLYGKVRAHSAKNTVLPLLAASVLTDEQVTIRGVPAINDVENMLHILSEVGCSIKRQKDQAIIDSSNAVSHEIPTRLTKELRSSVFMLGSVLTRFHRVDGSVKLFIHIFYRVCWLKFHFYRCLFRLLVRKR